MPKYSLDCFQSNIYIVILQIDIMSQVIVFPRLLTQNEYQKMSSEEKEIHIKEILRETLDLNQTGVTITQLKQKLPFDRRIIEKHLDVMEFTNEIYSYKLGNNKLYIPNHKAMHEATSYSERLGDTEFQVYILRNKLGDFAIIQQKNLKNDAHDIAGGIQIPLKHYEQFVKYLRRSLIDMERRGIH